MKRKALLKLTIVVSLVVALAIVVPMLSGCLPGAPTVAPPTEPLPPPPTEPLPPPPTELGPLIIEPVDEDYVPYQILVKGISPELPPDSTVWVCVYVADRYYPAGPASAFRTVEHPELTWQLTVWIGQPEEFDRQFDIFAVLADEESTELLADYLEEAEQKQEWRGMTSLPEGATIYDKVTVTRTRG